MLVTAWILLIFFGLLLLGQIYLVWLSGYITEAGLLQLVFSIFVVALAAGIIWGGLLTGAC